MWAFLTGRNIDWSSFIRFNMLLAKKDGEPLPYASLITSILEHFNVPLDGEIVESPKRTQSIGATTVARMGFQKQQNQWILTKVQRQQEQQERTPSPPRAADSAPPPTYIADLVSGMRDLKFFVRDRLHSFGQQFSERFDTLGQQIDHLGYRVSRLEGDMGSLRSHFGIAGYEHPVPPPFTPAPSVHHQMPCLNPNDCDDPTDDDGEDAVDDDQP